MAGDHSRDTFDTLKHYVGVLEQQGRVRVDADANEELAIRLHFAETEAADVIGACGAPKNNGGFKLTVTPDGADLAISPGRIYVEGRLCELESEAGAATLERGASDRVIAPSLYADGRRWEPGQWASLRAGTNAAVVRVTVVEPETRTLTVLGLGAGFPAGAVELRRVTSYLTQPQHPVPEFASAGAPSSPPASPPGSPPSGGGLALADGNYLAYLEVREREVTALEDPRIREAALGGPDTATRLQNVWQVRLFELPASPPAGAAGCKDRFPSWQEFIAPPTGRMNARTTVGSPPQNPCELPPGSGYRRLENQLYRVEVHKGGSRAEATFKWSRENGSVVTAIRSISGSTLAVAETGKDRFLSFGPGQWAEVYDDASELSGPPRGLVEIESVDPDRSEIVVKTSLASLEGRTGLKLRRWDQSGGPAGPEGVPMPAGWIDLEDGVQVQFGNGSYRAGDYWLIPARTATGEIEWPPFQAPNLAPIPQPPKGIRRRYGRLAIVSAQNGQLSVEDCRKPFAPLSEICAEDVCFDNRHCELPGAATVQDALDRLCEARDLRFHNKHLHGTGVVCGLQVRCGPDRDRPRRHVTVLPGYAIDCEGRDVVLERAEAIDVLDRLPEPPSSPPSSPPGSGEQQLWLRVDLGRQNRPVFTLEPAQPPANVFAEALKGTLIRDFLDRCVEPVLAALRAARENDKDASRKQVSALTTVWAPTFSTNRAAQPFLSDADHQALQDLYDRLRGAVRSRSFCALFDNARPLPPYPFADSGAATIYGKGFKTRTAVSRDGSRAFTFGAGNTVLMFDTEKGDLLAEEAFPGGPGMVVRAAAVSKDGRRLYAAADAGTADSQFAVADIGAGGLKWRQPATLCDVRVTALAAGEADPEKVFAIGAGRGLFEINPVNPEPRPQPKAAFAASGDLAILAEHNFAYATASSGKSAHGYDQVVRVPLAPGDTRPPQVFPLNRGNAAFTGTDGLALSNQGRAGVRLMVAVDAPAGVPAEKQVLLFDALEPEPLRGKQPALAPLGEHTPVKLAYNPTTRLAMAALEGSHRIVLFDPVSGQPANVSYPVGVSPRAITTASSGRDVYVLNTGSNTLLRIPADRLQPGRVPDAAQLAGYRAGVAEAFADLFAGVVQYLKDCFCDLLLRNCPECGKDEKLYLASVHIRNREVYQVCNFSQRKHVHTFPKLYYWLSLVPVLPLVRAAVERFCCLVFPELASRFEAPRPQPAAAGLAPAPSRAFSMAGILEAFSAPGGLDLSSITGRLASSAGLAGEFLGDFVAARIRKRGSAAPVLAQSDLKGLTPAQAREKLERIGIRGAAVEKFDPERPAGNLISAASAPARITAGDRVTLIEQDGVVRFARLSPPATAAVEELRGKISEDAARAQSDLAASREAFRLEVEAARAQFQQQIEARDRRVAELEGQIQSGIASAREAFRAELETMRGQLGGQIEARDRRIAALEEGAKAAEADSKTIRDLRAEIEALKRRPR